MKNKRLFSVLIKLLSLMLSVSLAVPSFTAFAEQEQEQEQQTEVRTIDYYKIRRNKDVHIKSKEDFLAFAESCVLDSNSADTNYLLECDIDFAGEEFEPIPSFSGIFFGFDHKITGVSLKGDGSALGLFRYIEEKGVVLDLNVTGNIIPGGKAEKCGGIAGVNRGTICGCTFWGRVQGSAVCGGAAGLNEKTGLVCSVDINGFVSADNKAGGVVGSNEGLIMNCRNYAAVNKEVRENSLNVQDVDIEEIRGGNQKKIDMTDAGGIAGYSSGAIYRCRNYGNIGYQRVGYNVGGIAGRQVGYIDRCENRGEIQGRKDIGGIVGQAEPYMSVLFSENNRAKLKDELDELNEAVDVMIDDVRASGDRLTGDNEAVNSTLENVRTLTDGLLDDAEVIINEDIDSVNELLSRIDDFINLIAPILDDFADAAEEGKLSFEFITESINKIVEAAESADSGIENLGYAYDCFSDALDSLAKASENVRSGMKALENSFGDTNEVSEQLDILNKSVKDFSLAAKELSDAAEKTIDVLENGFDETSGEREEIVTRLDKNITALKNSSDEMKRYADKLSDDLEELSEILDSGSVVFGRYVDTLSEIAKDIKGITDAARGLPLSDIISDTKDLITIYADIISSTEFKNNFSRVRAEAKRASEDISDAADAAAAIGEQLDINSFGDFIKFLKKAGENSESVEEYLRIIKKELENNYPFFSDAVDFAIEAGTLAEEASDRMTEAIEKIEDGLSLSKDTADYFSFKDKVSFTGISDNIINSRKSISIKLSSLIDSLVGINSDVKDTISVLSDDFEKINEICGRIGETVSDILVEISETSTDIEDYTEDISSEDTYGRSDGKICSSLNYGKVEGDLCIGGIAGNMGVDVEFDQEINIDRIGERSADFVYRSKTIIRDCINNGITNAQKNQGGGIVGNMDTGCIMNCESYGDIVCEESGYIGGIAGKSKAVITGCYAMCTVGGNDYVGGIAGTGKDIADCISFVNIVSANEKAGKIAGDITGDISANVFVDETLITGGRSFGAIDGISYKDKASPENYNTLIKKYKVPAEFKNLRLIFMSDEKVIDEVPYTYGEAIDVSEIPACPTDKSGAYMIWEDFDTGRILYNAKINAVMKDIIPVLVSDAVRENGKNVFAVEGKFTEADSVYAQQNGDNAEEWNVKIPGAEKQHVVRYLTSMNKDKTEIIIKYAGGRIEKPVVTVDGSYIVFSASDCDFTLTAKEIPFDILDYLNIIIAVGAVVVLIIVIVSVKKIKKKNNKENKTETDN